MAKRKIRDEQDARWCLAQAEATGLTSFECARKHGPPHPGGRDDHVAGGSGDRGLALETGILGSGGGGGVLIGSRGNEYSPS